MFTSQRLRSKCIASLILLKNGLDVVEEDLLEIESPSLYRSSLVEKHVTKTELPHKLTPLYEALTETENVWSNSTTKRFFDFTVAFVSLLLLWPIFSLISLAILFDSEGPAIFRQYRIGRMGHPFIIYKFRTMFRDAEHGPRVTTLGDQRTTRIGSILRKTKLDELPQLLNVLKGDMSLVGPRPKVPGHDTKIVCCRPGITGAATLLFSNEEELLHQVKAEQVEKFAVEVLNPVKVNIDRQYRRRATFLTDFQLLLRTVLRLGREQRILTLKDLERVAPVPMDLSIWYHGGPSLVAMPDKIQYMEEEPSLMLVKFPSADRIRTAMD